jgi:hypothetical protein
MSPPSSNGKCISPILLLGQRDILTCARAFANEKREAAIAKARQDGVELLFDDDT